MPDPQSPRSTGQFRERSSGQYVRRCIRHLILLLLVLTIFVIYCGDVRQTSKTVYVGRSSDLCRRAFEGVPLHRVRVTFISHFTPTDDPLVFLYHPGVPATMYPPTVQVRFSTPPQFARPPFVVEGTYSRIDPDSLLRRSNHLGVVVITDAVLVPPASP